MDVDIVSFRRLLHHLLDELGDRIPTVLDDIGKSLVLRRVLAEHAGELPRFGSKAGKPGFIEEVKSLLSEFVRYEVTADVLEDVSERTEDTLLSDKLREFSVVYRQFREKCGETRYLQRHVSSCERIRAHEGKRSVLRRIHRFHAYTVQPCRGADEDLPRRCDHCDYGSRGAGTVEGKDRMLPHEP